MNNIFDSLKRNNVNQNNLALYFLFEYGKQILQNESEISKIKEKIKERNSGKHPIFGTEYETQALDIAVIMSKESVADLCKYIYSSFKAQNKQERNR